MGCPKLTYRLTAEPRLRCVYNAADEEESHFIYPKPVIGRFVNPDPYVQNLDFSQNFNRYSYELSGNKSLSESLCLLSVPQCNRFITLRYTEKLRSYTEIYCNDYSLTTPYCFNNPLIYADPSGKKIKPFDYYWYYDSEYKNLFSMYGSGWMSAMNSPSQSFFGNYFKRVTEVSP